MLIHTADNNHFSEAALLSVSEPTRAVMKTFCEAALSGEKVLRSYRVGNPSSYTVDDIHPMERIKVNANAVHNLTWIKATLYSRSVISSYNDNNLLVTFQSLRSYIELVATVRYTLTKLGPIIHRCVTTGLVTREDAHRIASDFDILLRGGRFDWHTYFLQGAASVMSAKKKVREKAERQRYASKHLRIKDCVDDWAKEVPAVEFIYDYLCDIVHPNMGSNLILMRADDDGLSFDHNERSKVGSDLFERIFPYAASACVKEMGRLQMILAIAGATYKDA